MATKTDYARKCQQLDVLIDLLERENKRLRAGVITCDRCVVPKRGECIWHNAGATYCSLGEVDK
jgi:hypothetical protein